MRDVITRCKEEYAEIAIGFPMYMLITNDTDDS